MVTTFAVVMVLAVPSVTGSRPSRRGPGVWPQLQGSGVTALPPGRALGLPRGALHSQCTISLSGWVRA